MELGKHEGSGTQLTMQFSEDEKRQLQADIASWRTRLVQFDRDLKTEPARVREFYEVQAPRVEPIGLVYLWPRYGMRAMPAPDPNTRAHLEWLGFIQPNGLVVSAPALVKAGAILNRHDVEGQALLDGWVNQRQVSSALSREHHLRDFREFATTVLGWSFSLKGYAGVDEAPIPAELEVPLPDYGETLRPDFAVRERDPQAEESPWQLLVQVLGEEAGLNKALTGSGLEATPQDRMERLLRGTGVPAGLIFNGAALRLVSAPRGRKLRLDGL